MEALKKVNIEQIASDVAIKLNLNKEDVLKVYKFQFFYVTKIISGGEGQLVKLDFFGKFKVNKKFKDNLVKGKHGVSNYRR